MRLGYRFALCSRKFFAVRRQAGLHKYTETRRIPAYLCNVVHVFLHERLLPRNEFSVRKSSEKSCFR